jgi:hypothetical protein
MIKAQLDILELDYSPLRYLMGYSESSGRPPVLVGMLGWIIAAMVFAGVIVYGLSVYLDWAVLQFMSSPTGQLNFGILVATGGVVNLYYMSVQAR